MKLILAPFPAFSHPSFVQYFPDDHALIDLARVDNGTSSGDFRSLLSHIKKQVRSKRSNLANRVKTSFQGLYAAELQDVGFGS